MARYLMTIYLPDDYDPSAESEATSREIGSLNDEMVAVGVRIFVGDLHSVSSAKSLRTPVEVRPFH